MLWASMLYAAAEGFLGTQGDPVSPPSTLNDFIFPPEDER